MGSPQEHRDRYNGGQEQGRSNGHHEKPPPPPEPERDAGIIPPVKSPKLEGLDDISPESIDVFTLESVAALKLLCRNVEILVAMTGDVPPTPPVRSRGPSPAARHHRGTGSNLTPPVPRKANGVGLPVPGARDHNGEAIDGVPFTKTPMGSPEAHLHEESNQVIVGADAEPLHIQHGVLARKFYSKRPPPISLEEYLMRMHKYCPMSTAVYLATSHYITSLAIVEHVLPVTPRNVHRLVLAGLRVAMKALEDMSWPHSRFSKVGGVSENELGRLEITFCFLMDFNLKVDANMLQQEAEGLCRAFHAGPSASLDAQLCLSPFQLTLPTGKTTAEKRKASTVLPSRPAMPMSSGIEVIGQS